MTSDHCLKLWLTGTAILTWLLKNLNLGRRLRLKFRKLIRRIQAPSAFRKQTKGLAHSPWSTLNLKMKMAILYRMKSVVARRPEKAQSRK